MSGGFLAGVRTRHDPIIVGETSDSMLRFRAQVLEAWDAVRIYANGSEAVKAVKLRALDALYPDSHSSEEFVVKIHGFEILDESVSLSAAGVKDGSTLLIADRRRRPVS